MKLTRKQRQVRDAIQAGGQVICCAWEDDYDDPRCYYVLLTRDETDPIGLGYVERVQYRTLWPLWVHLGLLNDQCETPNKEEVRPLPPSSFNPAFKQHAPS